MKLKIVWGTALCAGVGLAVLTAAGTPYQGIVDRNVFALKPPPPPPKPAEPPPKPAPPPRKITPTGIMQGFGMPTQVLFKAPPGQAKPGVTPQQGEQSYMLAVGQRVDDIEVLEINAKEGIIKFNNAGEPQTLSLDKDGQKAPPGVPPGVPGVAGAPPMPGGQPALPGMRGVPPPQAQAFNPAGPFSTLPARTVRSDLGTASPAAPYPGVSINGMTVPPPSSGAPDAATLQHLQDQQTAASRSVEMNVILYEAARAKRQAEQQQQQPGVGIRVPIMPPHPLMQDSPE